ncbi:MAG TPA: MarR family transcriptional regulator [Ktedonobacteraceae bacterium]|nr:MarR family transcriptional regulator [Ktedonobacteraceae bacterium]
MESDSFAPGSLLGRELSTAVVLFHQAVAERVGLSATDLKCLDVLDRMGSLTAGQLAELVGLTGGAITAMIDRLEVGGFVQRERDPTDRRRVFIKAVQDQEHRTALTRFYEPLQQAMREELAERYSPEVLAMIEDFLQRTIHILHQQTQKLSQETARQAASGSGEAGT